MDPHARAFTFLGMKTISDDLVISDSEPEPSLRSTTTKATISTYQSQPRGRRTNRFSATKSIIEISDDSSRRLPSPVIIELSVTDDSDSGEEIKIIEKSHVLPATRPQPPPPRAAATTSKFSFGNLAPDVISSDSETLSIDFSQFAYSAQPSQPKSRAMSQSSVRSTHSIRSVLPEKPSNARLIHSATDFLTDRQIDLLSRCVACAEKWTAKKTVSKKRYHLRVCQKKNALMDDTIVLLIERELASAPEKTPQKKGEGKAKEKSVSLKKHATLMNAVVTDALPKKRTKKKEKPATIIGIQDQHETIQVDARRLLGLDSDEEDRSTPGLSATTSTTVPLTQEFPVSKLGTRKGFEVDIAASLPSPVASDDDERKPISISSDSESRASGRYSRLSSHENGKHRDLQNALRQSLAFQNGEDDWLQNIQREIDDRENMAQWEDTRMQDIWHSEMHITDLMGRRVMEDNVMDVDSIPAKNRTHKPKALLAKDTTTSETPVKRRAAIRPPSSTTSLPAKRKASPHPGRTASPSKTRPPGALEALDQEHFNHLMQAAIKNDKALWQRILRYEPVNFTEFLDIALATGAPSQKLAYKLRVFLVSKAIQVIKPQNPWKRR